MVVRVVDGRPSPTLGTRGGMYPETSSINVSSADVIPKLQAQAEAAVRLLGYTPTAMSTTFPLTAKALNSLITPIGYSLLQMRLRVKCKSA